MPAITFPFKKDLQGIQIRVSHLSKEIWEVLRVQQREPQVVLVNIEDLQLPEGCFRRLKFMSVAELQAAIDDPKKLVFKPDTRQNTHFKIFGHKSDVAFPLSEEEITVLDQFGVTLLEDRLHGISWFGVVIEDEELLKNPVRRDKLFVGIRKMLAAEFNIQEAAGMEVKLHDVNFFFK